MWCPPEQVDHRQKGAVATETWTRSEKPSALDLQPWFSLNRGCRGVTEHNVRLTDRTTGLSGGRPSCIWICTYFTDYRTGPEWHFRISTSLIWRVKNICLYFTTFVFFSPLWWRCSTVRIHQLTATIPDIFTLCTESNSILPWSDSPETCCLNLKQTDKKI